LLIFWKCVLFCVASRIPRRFSSILVALLTFSLTSTSSVVYRLSIHILIPSSTHIRSYYSVVVPVLPSISSCDHLCFCPFDLSVAFPILVGSSLVIPRGTHCLLSCGLLCCWLLSWSLGSIETRSVFLLKSPFFLFVWFHLTPLSQIKKWVFPSSLEICPLPTPASFYVHLNSTLYPLRANALPFPPTPSIHLSIHPNVLCKARRQTVVRYISPSVISYPTTQPTSFLLLE